MIEELARIRDSIVCVQRKIGSFNILNEELVPEGLKPIARSISWLIEQIIVQNLRRFREDCGLEEVRDPPHGLRPYDCVLRFGGEEKEYFVNVKTSLTDTPSGRDDISKAERLIELYEQNPDLVLIVSIIKVNMQGINISFDDPILFNVAWVPDIYYNRANHNLQSICDGTQTPRTNEDFVRELRRQMQEVGHVEHY